MQTDEDFRKVLERFEPVEWRYDGLNGKIIPWTLENGGTSKDPSVQAFLVSRDGSVFARAPDAAPYQASSFTKWMAEQYAAWSRAHPRTRVPFVRAEVTRSGRGEEARASCPELAAARKDGKPLLLYFGIDAGRDADRDARKQAAACAKLEKGALDSKSAAKAAEGFVLLRFDLADEAHRRLAATYGVTTAPRLVLVAPGAEPEDLGDHVSSSSLAYRLKKVKGDR